MKKNHRDKARHSDELNQERKEKNTINKYRENVQKENVYVYQGDDLRYHQ